MKNEPEEIYLCLGEIEDKPIEEVDFNDLPLEEITWCDHAATTHALRYVRCDGWRPIETAPKDGTRVLLWNENNGKRDAGQWEDWSHMAQWQRDLLPEWAKELDGEWNTDNGEGEMTHWMPLPAVPEGI